MAPREGPFEEWAQGQLAAGIPRWQVASALIHDYGVGHKEAHRLIAAVEGRAIRERSGIGPASRPARVRQGPDGKVLSAVLSFLVPGVGQLTQDRPWIAIGMFVIWWVAWATLWFLLAGLLVSLWSAIDAARWEPEP